MESHLMSSLPVPVPAPPSSSSSVPHSSSSWNIRLAFADDSLAPPPPLRPPAPATAPSVIMSTIFLAALPVLFRCTAPTWTASSPLQILGTTAATDDGAPRLAPPPASRRTHRDRHLVALRASREAADDDGDAAACFLATLRISRRCLATAMPMLLSRSWSKCAASPGSSSFRLKRRPYSCASAGASPVRASHAHQSSMALQAACPQLPCPPTYTHLLASRAAERPVSTQDRSRGAGPSARAHCSPPHWRNLLLWRSSRAASTFWRRRRGIS
jgi:hypothetical protein